MYIHEFAERAALSTHTLRYYEKIGVLRRIARDPGGRRCFTDADLAWIEFVIRLKDTGMPLADIRRYAALRAQGEATTGERRRLLAAHARTLEKRITREHLAKINDKIDAYRRCGSTSKNA